MEALAARAGATSMVVRRVTLDNHPAADIATLGRLLATELATSANDDTDEPPQPRPHAAPQPVSWLPSRDDPARLVARDATAKDLPTGARHLAGVSRVTVNDGEHRGRVAELDAVAETGFGACFGLIKVDGHPWMWLRAHALVARDEAAAEDAAR
jgi:hypothetical protein